MPPQVTPPLVTDVRSGAGSTFEVEPQVKRAGIAGSATMCAHPGLQFGHPASEPVNLRGRLRMSLNPLDRQIMEKSALLASLALFTLLAGMAVAVYQLWSVDRAKKTGSHMDGSKSRPGA